MATCARLAHAPPVPLAAQHFGPTWHRSSKVRTSQVLGREISGSPRAMVRACDETPDGFRALWMWHDKESSNQRQKWSFYDDEQNVVIEEAYLQGLTVIKLHVHRDQVYEIDLVRWLQTNVTNPNAEWQTTRKIKRVLGNAPVQPSQPRFELSSPPKSLIEAETGDIDGPQDKEWAAVALTDAKSPP